MFTWWEPEQSIAAYEVGEVDVRGAPRVRPPSDAYERAAALREAVRACPNPDCGEGWVATDSWVEPCSCSAPFRKPLPPLVRMDRPRVRLPWH